MASIARCCHCQLDPEVALLLLDELHDLTIELWLNDRRVPDVITTILGYNRKLHHHIRDTK